MSYRFRTGEQGVLVLQVQVRSTSHYNYERDEWRDALVTDIPLGTVFPAAVPDGYVVISAEAARDFGIAAA